MQRWLAGVSVVLGVAMLLYSRLDEETAAVACVATVYAAASVATSERATLEATLATKVGEVGLRRRDVRVDNGYPSVVKDDVYRVWYGACVGPATAPCDQQVTFYSESQTGMSDWTVSTTPLFRGGGVGVIKDRGQYVAFGDLCVRQPTTRRASRWDDCPAGTRYANIAVSPHHLFSTWEWWFRMDRLPRSHRWDCHNNLVRRDDGKLVATTRAWFAESGRSVARIVVDDVDDLRDVSGFDDVVEGTLDEQVYAQVSFQWLQLDLGLVMVYDGVATVSCRLGVRIKNEWRVVGDIISLGPPGSFDSHICFAARPLDDENHTRLYYFGGDGPHNAPNRNSSLGLAILEKDRYVGFRGPGRVTTRYLPLEPILEIDVEGCAILSTDPPFLAKRRICGSHRPIALTHRRPPRARLIVDLEADALLFTISTAPC